MQCVQKSVEEIRNHFDFVFVLGLYFFRSDHVSDVVKGDVNVVIISIDGLITR